MKLASDSRKSAFSPRHRPSGAATLGRSRRGTTREGGDVQKKARRKHHRRGIWSEWLALAYLTLKGYRLVAWRAKTPVGEIDLIVKRGGTLVFVEVKGRPSLAEAAEAVHAKNQARVVRGAQYFLAGHPRYATAAIRFDVCLVAWYRLPKHLPHAFY